MSYPSELPNEASLVNDILASDIDFFHIRKPHFDASRLIDYIKQLDESYYDKVIIHSHYELHNRFNLGGIHINKKGLSQVCSEEESNQCCTEPLLLKNNEIEVFGKRPITISYAAHSLAEIGTIPFNINYIILSPIFDSISKPNYFSKFKDRKALSFGLKQTNQKIVALGGIQRYHENMLKEWGFSGYVLMGSYWNNFKIDSEINLLNKHA